MKILKNSLCIVGAFVVMTFSSKVQSQVPDKIPFDMPEIQIPVFKTDTFNVANFGAVNDGFTLNTKAINIAIEKCAANGGGVVLVPMGHWLTGPIVLKSNVNLHLASGAYIRFSKNKDLYPLFNSYYEGLESPRCQSPISGRDLTNIAITGPGIVDGSGEAWRQVKKDKLTASAWKKLIQSGGVVENDRIWYPSEGNMKGEILMRQNKLPGKDNPELQKEIKDFYRPVMVSLINCKKVLLDGPTFQNSPAWNIHPLMCEHITIRNLNVRNPWFSQNGDGLDLESCRIGSVTNCTFDVGDDAICIKSGKDKEGRERGMPTELIVVDNCIVYHGHGGFVIGSEMSGSVRNMYVTNCLFIGTDCGLRFKSNRSRGGVVENIYMKNIRMTDIPTDAITFNLYYGGKSVSEDDGSGNIEIEAMPVNEATPSFRNLYFENIYCTNAKRAVYINGLPEMPVKDLYMRNVVISSEEGIFCNYASNIKMDGVKLMLSKPNAIDILNSSKIQLTGLDVTGYTSKLAVLKGKTTTGILLQGSKTPVQANQVQLVNVPEKELIVK
jgi:polygalacturonase